MKKARPSFLEERSKELLPFGADPRLAPASRAPKSLAAATAFVLVAACTGSRVLLQTIDAHPDMPGFATLHHAATTWHHAMTALGATEPDTLLHNAILKAAP